MRYYLIVLIFVITGCEATTSKATVHPNETMLASYTSTSPAVPPTSPVTPSQTAPTLTTHRLEIPSTSLSEQDIILRLPWGNGPSEVGLAPASEGPTIGPTAIAVASDGSIVGILDPVNMRAVLANLNNGIFSNFPVSSGSCWDIAISPDGKIAILELLGEPEPESKILIPRLHIFASDGTLISQAPVYARLPSHLLSVNAVWADDDANDQIIMPFDETYHARSRDEQQEHRIAPELQGQLLGSNQVRLVDYADDLIFEIVSRDELGAIALFNRMPQGFVVAFESTGKFRVVWFRANGELIKQTLTPAYQYAELNPGGRVKSTSDGIVYILNSTSSGVEIVTVRP